MNIFWEIFQHLRTSEAKSQAVNAGIKAQSNQLDLRHVDEKLDSLSLITQAMWELLEERGYSIKDLERKVEEIDLRDGKKDGKLSSSVTHCPDCGHRLNTRRKNCFWCGAPISEGRLFPTAS